MTDKKITVSVTLELDPKWASSQTKDGLVDHRLNSSLGFRGQVKRFRVNSR
jgi:hypothetical protein